MKYFLLYGPIGNWITGLFMTEETMKCLIAFVILIGGAIVCEMIFSSLKKKKQYLFCLGILVAYFHLWFCDDCCIIDSICYCSYDGIPG